MEQEESVGKMFEELAATSLASGVYAVGFSALAHPLINLGISKEEVDALIPNYRKRLSEKVNGEEANLEKFKGAGQNSFVATALAVLAEEAGLEIAIEFLRERAAALPPKEVA